MNVQEPSGADPSTWALHVGESNLSHQSVLPDYKFNMDPK